ncbi:MAG: FecR domain-containing protein [Deltaproteobacteria bacterium]|nr:FecR domain-containing protein [Deltaproteobacteria bacterium]
MTPEPKDAEIRALRQMVDEVRSSLPPELDLERLERHTLDRIDREALLLQRGVQRGHRSQGRAPGSLAAAFVFAAAAAALILLISGQRVPGAALATVAPTSATSLDSLATIAVGSEQAYLASAVASGSRLMSGAETARFAWPGIANWYLEPGSSIVLERAAGWPRLTLEQGRLRAHVVPHEDATSMVESLVIEAGGTRVAVHGTTFSVTRDGDSVVVEVVEGVVAVGPSGQRGPTHGALLRGPSKAVFTAATGALVEEQPFASSAASSPASRDVPPATTQAVLRATGEPTAAMGASGPSGASPAVPLASRSTSSPASAIASPPRPTAAGVTTPPPSVATASPEPALPGAPSAIEASAEPVAPAVERLSLGNVRAQLLACLASASTSQDDGALSVQVSSEVRLRLDADRRVVGLRFAPPLRPDLQQRCGGGLFGLTVDSSDPSPSVHVEFSAR